MKLLVIGSRAINNYEILKCKIDSLNISITEIVSEGTRGIDTLAEGYARENNIPIKKFKPDWSKGKCAGWIRNKQMWEYCDQGILFWDGVSVGIQHSFKLSRQQKKNIILVRMLPIVAFVIGQVLHQINI